MKFTILDNRTPEEKESTIGFWIAHDKFLSGWGNAPGKSIVAFPVFNEEDSIKVERRFRLRKEFKRIRFACGKSYHPKLNDGDHLHIYNFKSFRYDL